MNARQKNPEKKLGGLSRNRGWHSTQSETKHTIIENGNSVQRAVQNKANSRSFRIKHCFYAHRSCPHIPAARFGASCFLRGIVNLLGFPLKTFFFFFQKQNSINASPYPGRSTSTQKKRVAARRSRLHNIAESERRKNSRIMIGGAAVGVRDRGQRSRAERGGQKGVFGRAGEKNDSGVSQRPPRLPGLATGKVEE